MKFSFAAVTAVLLTSTATATAVPNYGGNHNNYGGGNNDYNKGYNNSPQQYGGGNQGYDNNNNNNYNKGYDNYNKGYNNGGDYDRGYGGGSRTGPHRSRRTHYVTVGSEDGRLLRYTPPFVHARKHDIVRFEFLAKNHTVTQSDFDTPCKANGGFRTGFVPNPQGRRPGPRRDFIVKSSKTPAWFYCGQKQPRPHCGGGNEMVFAVNPPRRGNTFEKFAQNARNFPIN